MSDIENDIEPLREAIEQACLAAGNRDFEQLDECDYRDALGGTDSFGSARARLLEDLRTAREDDDNDSSRMETERLERLREGIHPDVYREMTTSEDHEFSRMERMLDGMAADIYRDMTAGEDDDYDYDYEDEPDEL